MVRKLLAVVVLWLSASLGFAANFVTPKQNIVKPSHTIELGEEAELTVTPLVESPKYLVATLYSWKIIDGGKERKTHKSEDGVGVWFTSGLKKRNVQVFLFIEYLFIVRENDDPNGKVLEVATRNVFLYESVAIGDGSSPEPEPTPPSPEPEPTFPDGKYGLSKKTYELVKSHGPGTGRAKGSTALAKSFRSIASKIAAGATSTIEQILTDTTSANQTALGTDRAAWEPMFKELQEVIYSLYASGKLSTKDDFKTAWEEIAAGMEKVK